MGLATATDLRAQRVPGGMENKVCLVTGATQGVGRAVALGLARRGATVVLLCRDPARGEATVQELIRATDNKRVELLVADLSSQAEVRRAADAFRARHAKLHVLVNNAMVLPWTRRVTRDGIEESLAVNHLSHFLLTNLLLPELKAAAPARIVNVTTTGHAKALDFGNLQWETGYSPFGAYTRTKLLNVLFTVELARRLERTGVTVNAAHPANMIRSGGEREFPAPLKLLMRTVLLPFHATPEKAAREPLRVAVDPALEGVTGKLFASGKERRHAPIVNDAAVARRAWDESERLVGLRG